MNQCLERIELEFFILIVGDATPPFPQHPFTLITSGPPPNSSGMPGNSRPPGPHDMIYPPQSCVVQAQFVAQPLGSHHGILHFKLIQNLET